MSDVTRVAVVGVGAIGRHHARVYEQLDGCHLVGVHDVDEQRAREAAERYDCRIFDDLQDVLESVDAISVAVPTPLHHEIGLRCLEAGTDVLIEKPLAPDLRQADELIESAERHGRVLQVGHVERYNPAVESLRGRVERPGFVEVERLGSFQRRSLETDVVLDLMIHDIDVVHSLVAGELLEVRAVGVPVLSDAIDIANARLEFRGGCIANLTASRVSVQRVRKVRIFQPEAYLSVDYTEQSVDHYRLERRDDGGNRIATEAVEVDRGEPLVRELQDFLDCVARRGIPRVDGRSARRSLETALSIRDAIAEFGSKRSR